MRLGPVLVMTPDLVEALRFYRDVLGLQLRERFDSQLIFDVPGGGGFHVFRCEHAVVDKEHGADAASVLSFEVASVEHEMLKLGRLGVRFLHATPNHNVDAGLVYAAFEAPGGNVHELVERR